jgi:hypothetical protein
MIRLLGKVEQQIDRTPRRRAMFVVFPLLAALFTSCAKDATGGQASPSQVVAIETEVQVPATVLPVPTTVSGVAPSPPQTTSPSISSQYDQIVIYTSGGMCRGVCQSSEIRLNRSGEWFAIVSPAGPVPTTLVLVPVDDAEPQYVPMTMPPPNGTMTATVRDKIFSLLNPSALAEIAALPKTAQSCPSAYDGFDHRYVFSVEGQEMKTSDCDVDLATAHPLLTAITEALPALQEMIDEQLTANEAALAVAKTQLPIVADNGMAAPTTAPPTTIP